MGNSIQTQPLIRFQDFQVNLETGELWKAGVRLKLQDQPFKILVTLLQRPGQVVTREELHRLIWPQESFGDFDHAINLAIAKLRATLGDSADVPHLIETLPRRGYRFIGFIDGHVPSKAEAQSTAKKGLASRTGKRVAAGAAILVVVFTFALVRFLRKAAKPSSSAVEVVPLVAMEGKQGWPSFSPDGNQVAFAEYEGPRPGIYTTLLGGEKPLQLTENPLDCCPVWSPDGQQIAFVRYENDKRRSFYTVPVLGGSERRLYTGPLNRRGAFCDGLSWSPDGKAIAFPESSSSDISRYSRISLLSLSDLTTKKLTSPSQPDRDCEPAFSPDGLKVAFVRGFAGGNFGDLFVARASGGEPSQITFDNSGGTFAWTQDGRELVFASAMGGLQTLWRVAVSGGAPRAVAGVAGPAIRPSIPRRGDHLVYQQAIQNDNIWQINLKDEKHTTGSPVLAFSSRGYIRRPSFSPNGKKVAFDSDRLGYSDIWVCDSDGSNCAQVTDLHSLTDTVRWSPDGRYLSFESAYQRIWQPFTVEMPGGRPRLINTGLHGYVGCPNWSRDGQSVYVCSDHSGRFQVWKVPFKDGTAIQMTTYGADYAIESDDGRSLYYHGCGKDGSCGIWKMPLDGGEATRVLDATVAFCNWVLTHTGIYFINQRGQTVKPTTLYLNLPGRIEFLDLATHEMTTPILTLEKPAAGYGGLALSPNGKTLYWGQTDREDSYIMLVKNFR